MAVLIDSGELPMLSKIDITKQPQRSRVISSWITAFQDVDAGLSALEPVLREIEHYRLWELNYTSDPKETLRQLGILKLADRFDGLPQMLDSYISRLTQGESAEKELRGIGGLCKDVQKKQDAAQEAGKAFHTAVHELHANKKSQREIAAELGVTQTEVARTLKEDVNTKLYNIQECVQPAPTGTSREATIRRLVKLGRDDLLDKVESGELSANAAAIEAGFRKKLTPLEAARKAIAKLTEEDRATLVAELIKENTQ